jgi:hypothetical protein
MSPAVAQIMLTLILLVGAVVFILLDEHELAIALVGAVAGQGATIGVQNVSNGKNGGKA